jgi:quercetin dioxygenase-like cupin family protein
LALPLLLSREERTVSCDALLIAGTLSPAMDARDLRDLVHFDPDGAATHELFETEHLWSQLICLERTQRVGPIGDPTSDALFVVVAGEVVIQVDKGRKRVKQWAAVLAPAGGEVTISNASTEPAVILVTAAPPPAPAGAPAPHENGSGPA